MAEWVDCPICGEPDTRKETDAEGNALIFCVNHACASNGGGVRPAGRTEKLEEFFQAVAGLTLNHDGVHFYSTDNHERKIETDIAVVYPSKLGLALEKVDKEWWRNRG